MRIAFYHLTHRQWDGSTPDREPLGGTQTAIAGLSRALAGLGHEVTVFGTPARPGPVDGVLYLPAALMTGYLRQHPVDVMVSTGNTELLHAGLTGPLHLFWAHNDYCHFVQGQAADRHAAFAALLAQRVDKVVAVSAWHAELLRRTFHLPRDHVWASRNGVDSAALPRRAPGFPPPRLIYTSVPDRGLDDLLRWLPAIRERVPEVELVILSGFGIWQMPEAWTRAHEAPIRALADQPGVRWLDPVGKTVLYRLLADSRLMTYPCHASAGGNSLAETSCLAAIEAQAMGVPVVTSGIGAMPETVRHGETGWVIGGTTGDPGFDRQYVDAVVALLRDDRQWAQLSQGATRRMQEHHDWRRIAIEWVMAIQHWRRAPATRLAQPPFPSRFAPPRLSVLIPIRQQAAALEDCLESLCRQTFQPFEVLVCDNGSTDGAQAVALSFVDRLNLQYFWQPDQGDGQDAAPLGLKEARGDRLVRLDPPTAVAPTFLDDHDRQAPAGDAGIPG